MGLDKVGARRQPWWQPRWIEAFFVVFFWKELQNSAENGVFYRVYYGGTENKWRNIAWQLGQFACDVTLHSSCCCEAKSLLHVTDGNTFLDLIAKQAMAMLLLVAGSSQFKATCRSMMADSRWCSPVLSLIRWILTGPTIGKLLYPPCGPAWSSCRPPKMSGWIRSTDHFLLGTAGEISPWTPITVYHPRVFYLLRPNAITVLYNRREFCGFQVDWMKKKYSMPDLKFMLMTLAEADVF